MNCLREAFRAKVKLVCPEFNVAVSVSENHGNNNQSVTNEVSL